MSEEYKKGLWTVEEDRILTEYVVVHGKGKWNRISLATGLKRCGKSCRLRWVNYLSPDVKRGHFSREEDDLIIRLHNLLGNRWSLIAGRVPGRTDNQVKNHWNTRLSKKRGFDGPICRENARSVITTTSRHLPKVKRPKARLTTGSDPEKSAAEDDVSSRRARPTSQRDAITEDGRPSTSVRFSDVKLNLLTQFSEQLVREEHMDSTQPPLIAMPEAAEAIQSPKPTAQKELTDDQLMMPPQQRQFQ